MINRKRSVVPAFFQSRLFQRSLLFIVAFVALTGLSGSWLISVNRLFFPFYFWIYGSAGKSILFALAAFFLLTRGKITAIKVQPFSLTNLGFGVAATVSLGLFFTVANQLLAFSNFNQAPILALTAHLLLWAASIFCLLAAFGWNFLQQVLIICRRELMITVALAAGFYIAFSLIFKLWPYLSIIVLWAVSGLLSLTISTVSILPPLTLQLPQFAVTIGEYCSGIESLFLLSALYILIGCLEWPRLQRHEYFSYYLPLVIGMFALNILRVYLIILAGIFISPEVASKLFHTYLGMLLFLGYFFIFWRWAAPKLIGTQPPKGSV